MTSFFELRECDVINVVYTAHASKNIRCEGNIDTSYYSYENKSYLYDSGTNFGIKRDFADLDGNIFSQSYDIYARAKIVGDAVLTGSEKYTINRLRNLYASSSFYKPQNYACSSLYTSVNQECTIINIPNFLFGSQIKPGSFNITSEDGLGLPVNPSWYSMYDDGYGGIYITDPSHGYNQFLVGCIFYEYGLIYLVSHTGTYASDQIINPSQFGNDIMYICFSATNHIPMNVYLCSADKGMLNFSNNSTYTVLSGTKNEITTTNPKTFITSVNLYDEDYELVAIAKLSSPILLEEDVGIQFRLKMNY